MRLETIIDRAKVMGLPLAKDAFRETKENPLPVPPYLAVKRVADIKIICSCRNIFCM